MRRRYPKGKHVDAQPIAQPTPHRRINYKRGVPGFPPAFAIGSLTYGDVVNTCLDSTISSVLNSHWGMHAPSLRGSKVPRSHVTQTKLSATHLSYCSVRLRLCRPPSFNHSSKTSQPEMTSKHQRATTSAKPIRKWLWPQHVRHKIPDTSYAHLIARLLAPNFTNSISTFG